MKKSNLLQKMKGQPLLLIFFLLLHTAASFYYISQQNITYDEPGYIEYAKRWLQGHPERILPLDDSKSPVIAICWVPRVVRQVINPHYKLTDYGRKDQAEGRYMMILFSFLTAFYVYCWCKDLYGVKIVWWPLLLLLFDPLYLAYSTLITTDLACGAFLVAMLYHFRKYLLSGKAKQLCIAALYTGIAIVTKQTLVFVFILLPVISAAYWWSLNRTKTIVNVNALKDALVFCFIVLFVINAAYYFHHSFMPFGSYVFQSQSFIHLQSALSFLDRIPVPLPEAYMQSLDMLKAHAEYGAGRLDSTYNGVYLFGDLKLNGGYWYYYIVMLFYKMPLGTLFLLLLSVELFIKQFNKESFCSSYSFLVLPIFFFLAILSFFNNFQIGIRHLLLIFPLIYIGFGKLFFYVVNKKVRHGYVAVVAACCSLLALFFYYPYIIPYTNAFAGSKKKVYTKMMDSGIDYGQSDSSVNGFIASHPGYKQQSAVPATGKYAIPMAHVVSTILWDKNPYKWYQKIEPTGLYRNVVLLYDINEEDLRKAGF